MAAEAELMATGEEYMCAHCGGVFVTPHDWTEEDRGEEAQELFGSLCEGPTAVVCDGCFQMMMTVEASDEE